MLLACLFQTLESFALCVHGADLFVQDDVLSRCGTDYRREPPQVGRAPIGPAHVTESVSKHEGVETERGVLESAEGSLTCSGEIAQGFLCTLGDRDRGAIP